MMRRKINKRLSDIASEIAELKEVYSIKKANVGDGDNYNESLTILTQERLSLEWVLSLMSISKKATEGLPISVG